MNRLGKSSRNLGRNVGKSLGKVAGVSTNKMTSILFLLATILIALALSGVAFLVTRRPVSMPVISEGMDDNSSSSTDMSGNHMESNEEGKNEKKESMSGRDGASAGNQNAGASSGSSGNQNAGASLSYGSAGNQNAGASTAGKNTVPSGRQTNTASGSGNTNM
jgi:hypothetical protein